LLSYLLVNPYDSPSLFTSTPGAPTPPSPQLLAFLQNVRPRGLLRSARLKRDLEHLTGLHPTDLGVLLAKYPGEKLAAFCTHIRNAVHEKPWTLVSYAWCFYMAVFSGGRWIRAGLLNAGPDFWQQDGDLHMTALPTTRLSFWHFPGPFDGEDIKLEFKEQLRAAETLFSPDQRVDIIEEAKNIFQLCAGLVDELDTMVSTQLADPSTQHSETGVRKTDSKEQFSGTNTKPLQPVRPAAATSKSRQRILAFLQRPEITGTLFALACLACLTLFKH
jgi:heme oxygenase